MKLRELLEQNGWRLTRIEAVGTNRRSWFEKDGKEMLAGDAQKIVYAEMMTRKERAK